MLSSSALLQNVIEFIWLCAGRRGFSRPGFLALVWPRELAACNAELLRPIRDVGGHLGVDHFGIVKAGTHRAV
jgi:hypothetical protein